ncbi:3'(2'),5'-bisphosphate nucleotidase CysQ [Bacillus sp. JJ1566]|uniref:3'(2'),5'-bisphosphate nucleotidase CysQ n=1 Tax=Bacillus sp. JJ1566 TaxID=3122961 RepID=UPI002FFDB89E
MIKLSEQNILLSKIIEYALSAGKRILEVYDSNHFEIELKGDQSPLTIADRESHRIIKEGLYKSYPTIPILSEEGDHPDYKVRKDWDYVWLVDPLDGTKEFIKRNGEFSVNIGLVKNQKPILGVIYVPVLDTLYFAKEGIGAYKLTNCLSLMKQCYTDTEWINQAYKLPLVENRDSTNIVVSRSHFSEETEEFIQKAKEEFGFVKLIRSGSSLKMCLVAEGKVDLYPRFSPSMEWDTAAGEAIVKEAGGVVIQKDTYQTLQYNKEKLENPHHLVKRQFEGEA